METIHLTEKIGIPLIGLGTWKLTGRVCRRAVSAALDMGYRHIDTADIYGNHADIAQAIIDSGIKRKQIFLTTKVWRDYLAYNDVIASVNRFLEELKNEYIDLLLIHWPNSTVPIEETLQAMHELKTKKKIRAMGVSNFTIPLLQKALESKFKIVNNQVEFHPSLNQKELKEFCDNNDIVLTAYSPIAQGADLKIPLIQSLAKQYEKTPAQIILNWIIKKHIVVIPRSSKSARLQENLGALSFSLKDEDSRQIDLLNLQKRIVRPSFAPF